MKLFYKVKTKTLPEYFQELFSAANPTPYELRATPLFQETVGRSGSGKKCPRYHLPNIINKTDSSMLELCKRLSYRSFTDAMKMYSINKYSTACTLQNCNIYIRKQLSPKIDLFLFFFFLSIQFSCYKHLFNFCYTYVMCLVYLCLWSQKEIQESHLKIKRLYHRCKHSCSTLMYTLVTYMYFVISIF